LGSYWKIAEEAKNFWSPFSTDKVMNYIFLFLFFYFYFFIFFSYELNFDKNNFGGFLQTRPVTLATSEKR
jgi:hypothetical protein